VIPLVKKEKNSFLVKLNKNLYGKNVVEKLAADDREWVKVLPANKNKQFYFVELNTPNYKDVLEWTNYLFFLSKTT